MSPKPPTPAKPITVEMIEAMDADQRKTLYKNALARDTDAARAVLEILSQHDLMAKPKAPAKAPATRKPRTSASKPKGAATKPIKAVYGRQS